MTRLLSFRTESSGGMMWAYVSSEEGGEGDLIRFLEKSGGIIWKYGEYCLPSQAVTTNHRCIWIPVIYEVRRRK